MLIALEGIDGAGKSTIATALCARLASEHGYRTELLRKRRMPVPDGAAGEKMRALRELIWGHPRGEPSHDEMGTPYHLFLHAAWFSVLQRRHVQPSRERPGEIVVADGWYYRSAVKAVVRDGMPVDWCLSLFDLAGGPDVVVLVDLDPDVAWRRRGGDFTPSELGRWDGHSGGSREAFLAYQSQIRGQLRKLALRFSWEIVEPEETWSEARNVDEVHARVLPHLAAKRL